jgi:hypothetical protein
MVRRVVAPWLIAAGVSLAIGCGKKGPPLAPIVRVPAQVDQLAARRIGSDVYVTLTVPQQNIDATMPADITRIEVYGYTGRVAPPRATFLGVATLVATVPVLPPPAPEATAPPDPAAGASQGASITIVDTLTADELEPGREPPPPPRGTRAAPAPQPPPGPASLRRFYTALPFGPRGVPGPPGTTAELTMTDLPEPPTDVAVSYDASNVLLTWEPAGGVLGFLIGRDQLPMEEPPFFDEGPPLPDGAVSDPTLAAALPSGPTQYVVYREIAPDPLALPQPATPSVAWRATPPMPAAAALAALQFVEPVEFERERCYTVRASRGVGAASVESEASPRVCIRPIDIFPPAAPPQPATVTADGVISLIWEPVAAADLGGYVVLRGEPGDATLQPLTPAPIAEASYRDTTVTPGKRYFYAVAAVDDRVPVGNVSALSPTVEETAR